MRSNGFVCIALTVIVTSGSMLAGCSQEDSEVKEADSVLTGSWTAACADGQSGTMEATNTQMVVTSTAFSADGCTGSGFTRVVATHNYSVGGAAVAPTDATEINMTVVSIKVTLLQAAMVTEFNTGKMCGFSDWTLNTEKDVTGANCGDDIAVNKAGDVWYNIFKLADGKLQLGDADDREASYTGRTAETRVRSYGALTYSKNQ